MRVRGDSDDSLDDSPGGKAAHKTTQHVQACTCMGATELQRNWPKCENPWGNQGFAAERTGTELLGVFPMVLGSSRGGCRRLEYSPKIRLVGVLPGLTHCRGRRVCSAWDRLRIQRYRFRQAGIWYSFRSRYRPDTRCLLTLPRGLGDCMNVASRLLRNPFAGGSDLCNNWIDHFNSPVNQMVYRSMAVPCLSLGSHASLCSR